MFKHKWIQHGDDYITNDQIVVDDDSFENNRIEASLKEEISHDEDKRSLSLSSVGAIIADDSVPNEERDDNSHDNNEL